MDSRDDLAAILDPDVFDPDRKFSKHHAAVVQVAARRHMAYEGADRVLAAGWEHPDDEVLVEGSWFARPDLPQILGNFMRRCDEYGREAKALAATVERVRALAEQGFVSRDPRGPFAGFLTDLRRALDSPGGEDG